jgi:hypothetical protein
MGGAGGDRRHAIVIAIAYSIASGHHTAVPSAVASSGYSGHRPTTAAAPTVPLAVTHAYYTILLQYSSIVERVYCISIPAGGATMQCLQTRRFFFKKNAVGVPNTKTNRPRPIEQEHYQYVLCGLHINYIGIRVRVLRT